MRRVSVFPEASTTKSRVELVPQSITATGPGCRFATVPAYHSGGTGHAVASPRASRIGSEPGCRSPVSPLLRALAGAFHLEVLGHPCADRVVAPGQPPGQVGVQAFHTGAGAADSTGRAGAVRSSGSEASRAAA